MNHSDYGVLFLDIGGVLLSTGWGKESRLKGAKQFRLDFVEMNDRHNPVFNLFERRKISLNEYLEAAVFNHPGNFTMTDFKHFIFGQP